MRARSEGIDGIYGINGINGIDGIEGNEGIQGIEGIEGNEGNDGNDGNDGNEGNVEDRCRVADGSEREIGDMVVLVDDGVAVWCVRSRYFERARGGGDGKRVTSVLTT